MNEQVKLAPIQIGEQIPGTKLFKRWQDGKEISPLYTPDVNEIGVETNAIQEADQMGLKSVSFWDATLINIGGQWFTWSFPWAAEEKE